MLGDDSFNDSDEIFNLYSSKKVTDTFKAQFEKLLSSNTGITNSCEASNSEETCSRGQNSFTLRSNVRSTTRRAKKTNSSDASPENSKVCDSVVDNSIEIIDSYPPKITKRKSERLKKKRCIGSESIGNLECDGDDKINKPSCRRRKKSCRRKKRNTKRKSTVVEITLNDTENSSDNFEDDELNPEVSVKVIWKSVSVKKFKIRKFQKISKIFEELSKEENIPEDKIMLTFNNVKVNPNDTPDSLNMQVFHFLDGGVLSELTNSSEISQSQNSPHNSDSVILKFQDINKKVVKIKLNINEKMKVGMIKCSEQLEIPINKIKFFFDGESVDSLQTPASLGLENDEIIDIKICE